MRPLAFTGSPLDRDDHTRADPARLADARTRADARLLVLDGLVPPLGEGNALVYEPLADDTADLVFLGLRDGAPVFVRVAEKGDTRQGYEQRDARAVLSLLGAGELAIYGEARALADWHARHRFCANCGAPTALAKGGWQRDCGGCGASHFPRTDPVAIMLVEHDGALLLGRGLGWDEGVYSALAGFVEPGETIEEAVAREVLEEAGVAVRDVRYVASQPWPFPSQLMIGCHSYADDRALTVDLTELADARWFTREDVAAAMQKGGEAPFRAPPPFAIAHHLMGWWLDQD